MSLRYPQKALLELTGLGQQQFRNWKKIVLKGLPAAKMSKFALHEVVAIRLLGHLARDVGLQPGYVARFAHSIFDLCARTGLEDLGEYCLVLNISSGEASLRSCEGKMSGESELVLALDGILAELRTTLLQGVNQLPLPLTSTDKS